MTYTREHDAANEHPLTIAAQKKADRAVERLRKQYRAKAEKLRKKAEAMLAEAEELSYLASRYHEYETPYAKLREEIEEAGYWAARKAIGVFPRDADGNYVDPAPWWRVTLDGQFVGRFQAEERVDVLRIVCPKDSDRRWGEFTVEREP